MKTKQTPALVGACLIIAAALLSPETVRAHCDTLDGPVVQAARTALESGSITPVLKWVQAEDEQEIQSAFSRTMAVRSKGADAQELADLYFFETLVRIHRAGEGAPYTGLKSAETIDPAVALADQALENGSVDKLTGILSHAMDNGIRTRFQQTLESGKHANDDVEAGREFVKHYVVFTHYVEGLHNLIQKGGGHHDAGEKGAKEEHGH
ncbi:MAG: DUF6448 family protein [Desulfobulbaceae bacterium]|nr:DUF6448 family protein [Desulfobulbaceae bacterium]